MKTLIVGPNAITAKTSSNLADIFNAGNCNVVYSADGNYQSWKPGRALNAFDQLTPDKGYIAVMVQTLDVSDDFISTDDTGSSMPMFSLKTQSASQDLNVLFVDTDGTTVLATKSLLHGQAGLSGDLTPYLGKKIKFTRTTYNLTYFLVISSVIAGVQVYSTTLTPSQTEFDVTMPSDTTGLSLVIAQSQLPIGAAVYLIPGNEGEVKLFTNAAVEANLAVTVVIEQNDPIAGISTVTSLTVTIPSGDTEATGQFDVSGLANTNYLQVASLTFTNPDYYSFI